MDLQIFEWINGFAGNTAVLDAVMKFLSSVVIYILIGILIVIACFSKKRAFAFIGLIGIILGMGINYLITLLYARPRPFMIHDVTLLINKAPSASFPSDTTVIAFAAACALWLISRKMGWFFVAIAFLIAVSRVYVGHHYPTDVLAGGIVGIATTLWIKMLYIRMFWKKKLKPGKISTG